MGTRKLIHKTVDDTDNLLVQVWSSLIALEDNKAELARFLCEAIMHTDVDLPASFDLLTGSGFSNATEARSTKKLSHFKEIMKKPIQS